MGMKYWGLAADCALEMRTIGKYMISLNGYETLGISCRLWISLRMHEKSGRVVALGGRRGGKNVDQGQVLALYPGSSHKQGEAGFVGVAWV